MSSMRDVMYWSVLDEDFDYSCIHLPALLCCACGANTALQAHLRLPPALPRAALPMLASRQARMLLTPRAPLQLLLPQAPPFACLHRRRCRFKHLHPYCLRGCKLGARSSPQSEATPIATAARKDNKLYDPSIFVIQGEGSWRQEIAPNYFADYEADIYLHKIDENDNRAGGELSGCVLDESHHQCR